MYLFSDGFADQFGGPKGKKFKHTNLTKHMFNYSNLSMNEQKKLLIESFHTWQGNLEQLDDICVIGIKK